ncbi:YfhO family protein [Mucilaginibacter gynuensis]|uniref:YfhO family protein n=1 Tax=Mucilaginibacter gynuensis TaxID=1302236 RepID=A0ABP8GXX0_9SPHI
MNNWFKRNGVHFAVAAIFLVICFFYFTPAFQGKTLGQNDVTRAQSTQKEINDYRAKDTTILWTNQILGGMPAFQIWAPYTDNVTTHVVSALKTVFPNPVDTVLLFLFGTYLLFCVLKLNPWLSAAGAVAFTFSSYNIILLLAGHANQAFAIALFAPIIAGIILTLRGKYLLGASVTAFFLALEIRANHLQMTYYLMLAILILVGIEVYHAIKTKTTASFLKSVGYLAAATVLALCVNASILWSTYEYSKETIRGKSNLTHSSNNEPSAGLPRDYAYEWSQGVAECFTFLIPDIYGGSTRGSNDPNSHVIKALLDRGADINQAQNISQGALPLYWGDKRFTEGPFYFGAIICFLFVAGLLIVKNRLKWWILGTVILTMLLSFGRNFPFVSDLFFNYFPLYNKFRAVESILAVAQLSFALLGLLAIQEIITNPNKADLLKKTKIALYITGGLSLLFAVLPDAFLSFRTSNHQEFTQFLGKQLGGDATLATDLANALIKDRISIARADAIRSLIFVLISFGLVWAFIKQKINVTVLSLVFFALILVDMWQIDKRYLNDGAFVEKQVDNKPKPRLIDQLIARDTDPDYRVIDLGQNLLSDSYTPYFHKAVGGYSAARLKRYDELVENQLTQSLNQDVLDMLNTKYIITYDPKTQEPGMKSNTTACGHAWFVKSVKFADNADQEMQAISSFSPKDEAIVDKSFKDQVKDKNLATDPAASIKLVSYNPDHMVYESGSTSDQIAVFSEVYYDKGWKMLIDGVEQPYFRADYLLRAAQIPLGNHKIEFIFHPTSYYTGEVISLIGSIILILALIGALYLENKKKSGELKTA